MNRLNMEMARFFDELYESEAKPLVYGDGRTGSRLMMIGEAPGEQETLKGRPFVGKAGKNLDEFLALSGLARSEIYITNAVKLRPTRQSASGRTVNRPPTREEIKLFLPWLTREIKQVDPECVVTLGNVPLRALMGQSAVIGQMHGQFCEIEGRRLYPLYHPASVIYNRSLREVYVEDVVRLGKWLRGEA